MIQGLRNMAGHASHIREIGPHVHKWRAARNDGNGDYQTCLACGARRYTGAVGHEVDWLAGGDWRDQAAIVAEPAIESDEPQRPRRGRPPKKV